MSETHHEAVADRLQVGDRVEVPYGDGELVGTIVEDRGNLGVGGRRILRVKVFLDPDDVVFEMPAEELNPAA